MHRRLLLAVGTGLLAACAPPAATTYATVTGKPEVTIRRVTPKQVRDQLVITFVDQQYDVIGSTDHAMTFAKRASGVDYAPFSSSVSPQPMWRATVTLVAPDTSTVRLIGSADIVTYTVAGMTSVRDVTGGLAGQELQQILAKVELALKSRPAAARDTSNAAPDMYLQRD
jgi:hypothetical protein